MLKKEEIKQIKNFEKELKKGKLHILGNKYYNEIGKEIPYPAAAIMKEIEKMLK